MHVTKLRAAVIALAALPLLGACANTKDVEALNARVTALEEKVNAALQKSAAAKIDASTALKIAVEK